MKKASKRMALWRARKRKGIRVVKLEISQDDMIALRASSGEMPLGTKRQIVEAIRRVMYTGPAADRTDQSIEIDRLQDEVDTLNRDRDCLFDLVLKLNGR